MFEIQGEVNTAVCFAKTVESEAIEQIRRMCDQEFTRNSCIRIMPDVHAGKGCTIGTTMTVQENVVPNIVGVDIGCGMYVVRLREREIDPVQFDAAAHQIPSGMDVWRERQEPFDLPELRCYGALKQIKRLERSLGTLGGGNHFIEIDRATDGTLYLVIHSGSRNLGKQVAELYQQRAIHLHRGKDLPYADREELIAAYQAAGRNREIQAALMQLKQKMEQPGAIPEDLCWLYGEDLQDYLHDVEICQKFALRNREKMAEILLEQCGLQQEEGFHTIHNYIDTREMILRKGAVAAHRGEKLLIPINMRDGSILAKGRGNPDWNNSAPHGAGRIMSRSRARRELSLQDYRSAMEGIYTTSVNQATLDESPMAYKSLEEIIDAVRESVEILDVLKPIYNFKAN